VWRIRENFIDLVETALRKVDDEGLQFQLHIAWKDVPIIIKSCEY
jgi:hypothetical protein